MDRTDLPFAGPARTAEARTSTAEAWQMLSGFIQAAQVIPQRQRAENGSLPLTVISGFLGAGKTTLLNRLLLDAHGVRIAVLVNDFGRINIDAALVQSSTGDTINLTNGCACCSVAGDLTRALIKLAAREDPPEAIVLEASGLADPTGIVQIALANPALRLDGVLAVVDAETALARAADPASKAIFLAQLAAADLIVLNKLDLVDETSQSAARAWLNDWTQGKPIMSATQSNVPAEVMLGIHTTRDLNQRAVLAPDHSVSFQTWSARTDSLLDRRQVQLMMCNLPGDIVRAKGILWLSDDSAHRTVYQRVGRRSSYVAESWRGATPSSSLVVIATASAIDGNELSRQFISCRAG